ncbi:hypothetical protein SDJN02_25574, partial [Cucurbita argyrosperma subsp. argyrosperma]
MIGLMQFQPPNRTTHDPSYKISGKSTKSNQNSLVNVLLNRPTFQTAPQAVPRFLKSDEHDNFDP